jgi:hypothetical protein
MRSAISNQPVMCRLKNIVAMINVSRSYQSLYKRVTFITKWKEVHQVSVNYTIIDITTNSIRSSGLRSKLLLFKI